MRQILHKIGLCLLLFSLFQCGGDNGASGPAVVEVRITSISPSVLSLGARMAVLTIQGTGFSAPVAVDFGSGIEIVSTDVPIPQEIKVSVNVSRNAQPGPRTIVVRSGSSTASLESVLSVSDNKAPSADFLLSPTQGTIHSTFELDASLSTDEDGTIRTYKWEISDGSSPSGRKVKKEFSEKGEYEVKLTVTDDDGGSSSAAKKLTVGDNKPPTANFLVTPASGTQLTTFTFDASSSSDPDGPLTGYRWNLGGVEKTGRIISHKFNSAGDYQIVLQVRDSGGSVAAASRLLPVRFFDKDEATREIKAVMVDFMNRFDDIERLSAEEIVVGFSRDPGCTGRSRELAIILAEQPFVRSAYVDFVGEPQVFSVNEQTARSSITNRFYGVTTDGEEYDSGVLTHNFNMVNESEGWKICSFFITDGRAVKSLRSVFGRND
jgi:PKD repeat protein